MYWLKKSIWYDPAKVDNKLLQNVPAIRRSHELYQENHGGKSLPEVKIQRGIFKGDVQSPLLSIITMMPLNQIHKKCTAGHKLSKSQEKSIPRLTWTTSNCLPKKEKKWKQAVIINSLDTRMEFALEKCATLIMKNRNRHMTDGREEKIRTLEEKETYKYLGVWKWTPSNKRRWKKKF